ncbi:MAG: hypothetical protein GY710_08530 [Desulfobacteraceae bacterium]|nr:hypothetical protein [Desulfobacteraceae bacterium]
MNQGNKNSLIGKNDIETSNKKRDPYGYEVIMDLHDCNISKFTREDISLFFVALCDLIKMERRDLHFWDDYDTPVAKHQTSPHTKGTSAVQFILTSSIVIHTLDLKGDVYINIFSCKYFDKKVALEFCEKWFSSSNCISHHIERV